MYEFNLPTRIIFGTGSLTKLGEEAKEFGNNIFLVTGRKALREQGILEKIEKIFMEKSLGYYLFDRVYPEPDVEIVDQGVELCRQYNADLVVGVGGGSAIDVAKAIAGLSKVAPPLHAGAGFTTLADYLEEVRSPGEKMKVLDSDGLPFIALPTTAGTGAEVTMNAVIINKKLKTKRSFRSPYLFAKVTIIDPELTLSLSPEITASTGMDTLTHLIEGYLSKKSNPFTDTLALVGIRLVKETLVETVKNGKNLDGRTTMSQASLFGGIVIANASLGLIHGIASFLGSLHNLPHGIACAVILPYVLKYNLESDLLSREKRDGLNSALNGEAVDVIRWLIKEVGMPEKLSELGIKETDLEELAEKSLTASSTKNNPREVSYQEVVDLLRKAL